MEISPIQMAQENHEAIVSNFRRSQIWSIAIGIILIGLSLFVYRISKYSPSGDMMPNQLLPITILREHNLNFDEYVTIPTTDREKFLAERNNGIPEYWLRKINGHAVSFYPIVPGILNIPVFAIADVLGVDLYKQANNLSHWTSSLIAALSVGLMYGILLLLSGDRIKAVGYSLVFAFATCVWSVAATGLWQHGPSLLFINAGLFFLLAKRFGLSGLFLSLATVNRPSNGIFFIFVFIYLCIYNRREVYKFILLSIIPVILLGIYSMAYWGSPVGSLLNYVRDASVPSDFTKGLWNNIFVWILSPSRGMLAMSPVFVFSFLYMWDIFFIKTNDQALWKLLSVAVVLHIIAYSRVKGVVGGWTFGYRYMIEIIPFLIIFLMHYWRCIGDIKPSLYLKQLFVLFVVFSVFVQFLGAFEYPCGFNTSPDSIIEHPNRVWYFTDSELTRCVAKLFSKQGK